VPIIQHQAIGTMLAEMAIGVENSRSVLSRSASTPSFTHSRAHALSSARSNAVWRASCAKDANDPRTTYLASIAKAYASATAVANADKCVQIFGGAGYNTGECRSCHCSRWETSLTWPRPPCRVPG